MDKHGHGHKLSSGRKGQSWVMRTWVIHKAANYSWTNYFKEGMRGKTFSANSLYHLTSVISDLLTPCINVHSGSKAKGQKNSKRKVAQFIDSFSPWIKKKDKGWVKATGKKGKFQQQETGQKLLQTLEMYLNTSERKAKWSVSVLCCITENILKNAERKEHGDKRSTSVSVTHTCMAGHNLYQHHDGCRQRRGQKQQSKQQTHQMKPFHVLCFRKLWLVRSSGAVTNSPWICVCVGVLQ